MQRTRHELAPGIVLDARRAVWFEHEKALAVADLHLGFAWAQRSRGSMLPLSAPEETIPQLAALVRDYQAEQLFILGDIVQRAVPLEPVREQLRQLCGEIGAHAKLRLLGGNHDRGLAALLTECRLTVEIEPRAQLGPHTLMHGDAPFEEDDDVSDTAGRIFIGHEHPAIRLGDGVASVKCPCFLLGPRVVILPAFSPWAAGSNIRQEQFLSPLAKEARFTEAIAILAGKLMPVRL